MKAKRGLTKFIFLGLSILTTAFILVESSLPAEITYKQTEWLTNVYSTIVNDVFNLKENVEIIKPTSLEIKLSNYVYNDINGYKRNEIPIGCTKCLEATVLPLDASNKSVYFEVTNNNIVNLSQSGNLLYIEGLETGSFSITAFSSYNKQILSTYSMEVVDLIAPQDFLVNDSVEIAEGSSSYLNIDVNEPKLVNEPLLKSRYFNNELLTYEIEDQTIASFSSSYIKGIKSGTTKLKISNGMLTKEIEINVLKKQKALVYPTSLSIHGNNCCYILDVDFDRQNNEKGKHNTPLTVDFGEITPTDENVIWSVDKPLVAQIDSNGVVRGYRKTSEDDVNFVVTATSVMDPTIKATFNMVSKHVYPTDIKLTSSYEITDKKVNIYKGNNALFNVNFFPINVSKKNLIVSSSNEFVAKAVFNGNSIIVYSEEEGNAVISIKNPYTDTIIEEITINVIAKPIVNEDNKTTVSFFIRKYFGGHAFLFLLNTVFFGIFLFLLLKEKNLKYMHYPMSFITILFNFVLAMLSEFIQFFIPLRSSSWVDIGIDMNGVFVGAILLILILLPSFIKRNNLKKLKLK